MTTRPLPRTQHRPVRQETLVFRPPAALPGTDAAVHLDLSAADRWGDALFLASDETAGIEILHRHDGVWADHAHVPFGAFFDLPGDADGEMDIEGIAVEDGWLWVTGSHSLKRGKPAAGAEPREAMRALTRIAFDANRQFIGRLPLVGTEAGPRPAARDGDRRAGHLKFTKSGKLRKWLADDPLLGPFVDLPSKDNGLDIEGLAVQGTRLWLGLRGPVLRGYAAIVELDLKADDKGRLKARRIDGRRRYRLHLLPTGGEGVRDLARDGEDLLVLLGPAMAGDGATSVLRWRGATGTTFSGLHGPPAVETALRLPYRELTDNPEGLTHWEDDLWLILHDSPHPDRLGSAPPRIKGDIWQIPR